jgi:hypothetical protein
MLVHFLSAAWYGDRELNLPLPDHWDVSVVDQEYHPPSAIPRLKTALSRHSYLRHLSF